MTLPAAVAIVACLIVYRAGAIGVAPLAIALAIAIALAGARIEGKSK